MVNNEPIVKKEYDKILETKVGIPVSDFKMLATSKLFEIMKAQDLSDFIMAHVPETIPFEKLTVLVPNMGEDVRKYLYEQLGDDFEISSFSALYDTVFATRREKKKLFNTAKAKIENPVLKPMFSREELDEDKTDLNEIQAKIMAADKLKKVYETSMKEYEKASQNFITLKKRVEESKCEKPNEEKFLKVQQYIKKYNDDISNANSAIQVLQNNNRLYEKTLTSLDKPVCPISEKLVCTTDKSALKDELQQAVKANNDVIAKQTEILTAAKKYLVLANKEVDAYHKASSAYSSYLALKKQLDGAKEPEQPKAPEISAYNKEDFQQQKDALKRKEEELLRYETYCKDMAVSKQLQQEVAMYQSLVMITEAKGPVNQALLSEYFGILNKNCNDTAAQLGIDMTVEFLFNKGIQCFCRRGEKSCFYDDLSNGEKVLVTFIVLNMLNNLTGNRIIFIDNLNELDGKNLTNFLVMLYKSRECYDHVFVAGIDYEEIQTALDMIGADMVF
jgi:hypothetical protein